MKQLPITEATDAQIEFFCRNVQQIADVPEGRGPMLGALVQSGYDSDFILVEGEETSEAPQSAFVQRQRPVEQVAKMPLSGFGYWKDSPMVTLKILPTDRPGGNEPAHPSINGSPPMVIQRNKLVSIPYDFYLDLKQAGGTKVTPGEKPTDDLIHTDYFDYPMTDIVLPSQEEIDRWQAYTSGHELGKAKAKAA
jgi:hypothetical protein